MRSQHPWTPRRAVLRGLEVLREESLGSLWFKILGELCYRRMIVMVDRLDRDLDFGVSGLPLVSTFLAESQIGAYVTRLPGLTVEEVGARLASGQLCIVGCVDGEIICRRWYMVDRGHIDYLDVDLELAAGVVYSYDVWVRPEFRRQGASTVHLAQAREMLRDVGMRARVSAVMPENLAGRRFVGSYGLQAAGYLHSLRLPALRRDWYRSRTGFDHRPYFRLAGVEHD